MDFMFFFLFGPFRIFFLILAISFGVRLLRRFILPRIDRPFRRSGLRGPDRTGPLYPGIHEAGPAERLGSPDQREPRLQTHESEIFRLAARMKGRITLSDVVLETGLGLKQAEELLEGMVDGTHVRMEVSPRGIIVYEFPELIDRFGA
jgi:hypothetical protein